jgi:integrase
MRNNAYMCKNRHGMYYARFIVPKHLQIHFNNKKEIRRTLQTDSRKLAIKRARAYRVKFEAIVDELMTKLEKGTYYAFETTLKGKTSITLPSGEKKTIRAEIKRNLTTIDEDTSKHKEHLLKQLSTEAEREEKSAYLQHEFAIKEKREQELHQEKLKAIATSVQFSAPAVTINPKLLSEYLKEYIQHKTDSTLLKGGWIALTEENYTKILKNFISNCDKPAAAFNKEDTENYIKTLQVITKQIDNAVHSGKFKNALGIEMLIDGSVDSSLHKKLAPSTMRSYISIVAAFFNWMVKYKDVEELQLAIKALKLAKENLSPKSDRRPFSNEELKILFEYDNPAKENYAKGFKPCNAKRVVSPLLKYWLPLLGLYTGATLAELCQLHLSDIKKHKARDGEEHWIIDFEVHTDDSESRLKTDYRPRLIPVHNILLNLGFIGYAQDLISKGEIELFPTAKRRNIPKPENEAEQAKADFATESRWWATYSGKAGVKDKDVVFHSFRHNVNSFLDGGHIADELLNAISGHTSNVMGKTVYSKGGHRAKDIAPLVIEINKIDYGLNHHPFKLAV